MISFKLILGVLFLALVTAIMILGIILFQNNKTSLENADLVRHTHEVMDQTAEISSLYKDIQLESNAYFVHQDSSIIGPYKNAKKQIVPRIADLKTLLKDNPAQRVRADSIQQLIQELIAFTNTGFFLKEHYTMKEMDARVMSNFVFRERIRKCTNSIIREEQKLLAQRESAYEMSIAAYNRTFLLLGGGISVLLITTFLSVRYNFNKRIRAQEEQKKANELFAKVFYESPIGIVISRLDSGEIIDCNNSYTELMNYKKSDVIGKTALELGIVRNEFERNELISKVRKFGIMRDIEIQLNPRGSLPIWVSKSMQTIYINNEECLLSAILDMSSHKEAEKKMQMALESEIELNKLKSNFVTLASHEFRTPLTTILSSAFLVENYSAGGNKEKVAKHVSRIKASVNLLISILDEFLSLTKIEEGKLQPRPEVFNLKHTIDMQCNTLMTFAKPGQKITYSHEGAEEVVSDAVLVGNIVNNLVSNAIKYSGENGEIFVTSVVDDRIHLSVKDFGIGISRDDQEHLFERFFRASNTGNVQGTGLGLHIMKHYVDSLNGSIKVQSEPGKGSQFDITLMQLPTNG